jgi:Fur family ferric uptake transcriptional regulator
MKSSVQKVFEQYLIDKGIRYSKPRMQIFNIFIKTEKHLTAYEIYELTKAKYPRIGYATVYRAMKVICDAEIAEETNFGDGSKHYEHKYGHDHHDHLICTECGRLIEVLQPEIEAMQQEMAQKHNFTITSHKLQIYGICGKCSGDNSLRRSQETGIKSQN